MYSVEMPMVCGVPRRKSAHALYKFVAGPLLSDVTPPEKVKPPRGPNEVCGWKWLMAKRWYSAPKRIECEPCVQLRLIVPTYSLSRNKNGLETFGFPKDENPVTPKFGYPPSRK